MGFQTEMTGGRTLFQQVVHKLFSCPTFWQSFLPERFVLPQMRCLFCNVKIRCYWDGNDTFGKIEASPEQRHHLLMGFLGGMLTQKFDDKIYLAGAAEDMKSEPS